MAVAGTGAPLGKLKIVDVVVAPFVVRIRIVTASIDVIYVESAVVHHPPVHGQLSTSLPSDRAGIP